MSLSHIDQVTERTTLETLVLGGGNEPDPRFTLANERTFLAWTRTSLAFLAGGIALEAFPSELFPAPLRTVLAVLTISIGLLISAGAAVRWLKVERAMRNGRPLPMPAIVPLLSLGVALTSGLVLWVLL